VKRIILWIITIFCFLASGYSSLNLMMVAMLSGAPHYSAERAQFSANLWGSCTIIFFVLGVVFSVLIWKTGKRKRNSVQAQN
jgi:hypothetical protein